jgi:hypothetical protein
VAASVQKQRLALTRFSKGTPMKTHITSLTLVASSLLLTATAFADEAITSRVEPKIAVGAQVELLPLGSFHLASGQLSRNDSAEIAYGVSGTFDYALHRYLSIGFAPRLVMNVIAKDVANPDAAQQVDLRVRLKAHAQVAPGVEVYGYVAPGYSILFDRGSDNISGLAIAFGAGVTYDLSPSTFLSGEVGYQVGFQSEKVLGQTVDLHASYLHVGFGAGARF